MKNSHMVIIVSLLIGAGLTMFLFDGLSIVQFSLLTLLFGSVFYKGIIEVSAHEKMVDMDNKN